MSSLSSIQEILQKLSVANTQTSKASTVVTLLRGLQLQLQKVNGVVEGDLNEIVRSLIWLLQYGVKRNANLERSWKSSRSSESEISDGPDDVLLGARGMKGSEKVRLLVLTCFQALIKQNPKLLHQYWPKLLPDVDTDLASPSSAQEDSISLAHLLLNDPCIRIRHAAAVTLSTLLEGPAQRAYLAIAEYRASYTVKPAAPLKGFISLSETIGRCVVGTHQAVFASLEKERDIVVSCATLRLLWTLLIGSPYVKLPHNLLTSAISTIDTLLQRSIFPSTLWKYGCSEDASLLLSVLSGCLTCGAALCGTKPPVDYLEEFLLSSQRAKRFLQTIIDVASRQECTTAKLEALMVVRGLAQNYPAVKPTSELFSLAVESIEFCILNESISDTSVMEKVAQQSILLAGDCLSHVPDLVAWRAFLSLIMRWAISHERPMIRAASVVSLATIVRHEITDHLCKSLLQFVLYESSRSMIMDASSPVRAASCKLMASLFPIIIRERYSFIDICHITCALQSASQDGVLAVRIQAAGALATCADSLEKSFRENNRLDIVEIYESNYYPSIMQLLRVAIVASVQMENERVKPFALHALGVLFSLAASLEDESINCQGCVDYSRTLDVIYSSLSSKTAKVQWAACGAAEIVLKSVLHLDDNKIPEINLRRMVDKLQELECDSENSRSRLLARDALANAGMFQPVDGR